MADKHGEYEIVLASPPFGKKSSVTILRQHGRAAAVLPDNVLFFDRNPAQETPWTKQLWIYDLRSVQPEGPGTANSVGDNPAMFAC